MPATPKSGNSGTMKSLRERLVVCTAQVEPCKKKLGSIILILGNTSLRNRGENNEVHWSEEESLKRKKSKKSHLEYRAVGFPAKIRTEDLPYSRLTY